MIQIGDKIVSRDLFDHHFICHLSQCEGNCCVYGDSGAPLSEVEVELLESHEEQLKHFLRAEGKRAVTDQGAWVLDHDGDKVTPLVAGEECAYAVFEGNMARCAIEKAYEKGAIPFQKPLSCHLYPIRVTPLKTGIALNYHQWSICAPARKLGAQKGIPVFRFLKESLVRAYGRPFYDAMEEVYRTLQEQRTNTF
jgi:hypothetical protein